MSQREEETYFDSRPRRFSNDACALVGPDWESAGLILLYLVRHFIVLLVSGYGIRAIILDVFRQIDGQAVSASSNMDISRE